MAKGLFVVGTDTGVGKTTVSVGLVSAWTADGKKMAVMKPVETGNGGDAAALLSATGRPLDPALVNPYRFPLPAAPEIAARRAKKTIALGVIDAAYRNLAADADLTLVEGAGGLLVPLGRGAMICDLVARLDLPLLIVARTELGTMNHTLLTAEVARRRGLRLLGVVFCRGRRAIGPEESETVTTIVRLGELRSFGVLPWLPKAVRASATRLGAQVRQHLELAGLQKTIARD